MMKAGKAAEPTGQQCGLVGAPVTAGHRRSYAETATSQLPLAARCTGWAALLIACLPRTQPEEWPRL